MANPLKVLTALSASSGAAISGSSGLIVQQGGITVSSGNIVASTAQVTASALSASGASFLGTATVDSATIRGGSIDNTSIGATTQSSAKFTTISGSSTLQAGGAATLAGGLTVTGGALNASGVEVSASALSVTNNAAVGSLNVGDGYGSTGVTVSSAGNIQANGTLTVDGASTLTGQVTLGGDVVASNTGSNKSVFGTSTGTITLGATASTTIIGGNLVVRGTTTSVDSTTVNIGDKNINLGTGSSDLAVLSGGGLDLGTSAEVQWRYDNANTAWTSNKNVNVTTGNSFKINGTSVLSNDTLGSGVTASSLTSLGTITSLTASALNVTGLAKLDGNVNLGNASSDIVTVSGQLTASAGIKSNTLEVNSGSIKGFTAGFGPGGIAPATGSAFGLAGFENNAHVAIVSASYHGGADIEATILDAKADVVQITANGGVFGTFSGFAAEANGVSIISNHAKQDDKDSLLIAVSSDGGDSRLADGSIKLKAEAIILDTGATVSGTIATGPVNVGTNDNYNYITTGSAFGVNTINLTGALKALDTAIGGMSGASVSPTEYYNVRTVVKGIKQSGQDTVVFTISGSANSNENGRTPSGKGLTSMSSSNSDTLVSSLMAGMSFDIATKVPGTGMWTNDLVSVQLSASSLQSGFYWPQITVDAPSLTDGSEVRLIVVNENNGVII